MSAALELLVRHLLLAELRSARSPLSALRELREETSSTVADLCATARRISRANPKGAAFALTTAEDLARIIGAVGEEVEKPAPEQATVMNARRAAV